MEPEGGLSPHPCLTGPGEHKAVGRRQPGGVADERCWGWGDGKVRTTGRVPGHPAPGSLAMCYLLNPPSTQSVGMMSPCFQKRTESISHAEWPA